MREIGPRWATDIVGERKLVVAAYSAVHGGALREFIPTPG